MIKKISKKEFEERYPEISTYGLNAYDPVFLENGAILIDTEWNGEIYTIKNQDGTENTYRPVFEPINYDENGEPFQWEIIGCEMH